MDKKEPVKLLILEESQNRAEEFIVLLRTAGRATRAQLVESEEDFVAKLHEQTWDLLLSAESAGGLEAAKAIKLIREHEKDIPVVMVANNSDPASITAGLKLGAQDVALDGENERLTLIIERELGNLEARRQRRRAEVELRETERRNQLLLDSSNSAIAYVHEGMHIYTNRTYAELFGYDDPDEFAGIPIIDLISSEDQHKFKEFLGSYEDNETGTEEFSCVDSDDSIIICNLSLSPPPYYGEQ